MPNKTPAQTSEKASTQATQLRQIASQFVDCKAIATIEPLGNGNINSTFLVTLANSSTDPQTNSARRFVMQQINTEIFTQPELVMQNMTVLSEHLKSHRQNLTQNPTQPSENPPRRWEIPHVLQTKEGNTFFIDAEGNYWRAITFIEDSQVFDTVESVEHAKEVGHGLAMFHRLISDLPADRLSDTLEGFHITPTYLAKYTKVLSQWQENNHTPTSQLGDQSEPSRDADIQRCLSFIKQRQDWAHVLENAKAAGHLKLRPTHGDPKVNNIMFSANGQAVGLIDLDTLKPGLIHYDLGDCLRSGCNPIGEETKDWRSVQFDTTLAQAMLEGYLSLARDFLTEQDYRYLYDAIRLIAFELGLRFFTDYLAGSTYFKTDYANHNLDRALVQFQLTSSIELQADQIKSIIESLR